MTLQELVARAASLHSDRAAVWFDECTGKPPAFYTYATVVELARELTAFLQKYCDQQGKCEIGLYCYPGINLPSWILGILQVPAAYSPVDPDAPPTLSTYFMKKTNLQYILVENDKINKFRMSHVGYFSRDSSTVQHIGLTLFQMSSSNTDLNSQVDDTKSKCEPSKAVGNSQPEYTVCPDQTEVKTSEGGSMDVRQKDTLAYVLHTSGTTGIPKIVRVPHKCVVPNIQHLKSIFEITQEDVLFLASPLTFDPSVVELFVTLTSGASILIVPNTIKMMPVELSAALFHHHRVTVLQATPTLLRRFGAHIIKSTVLSANTSLRVLALGGEAFPVLSLLKSWKHKENKTSIFNLYGITEVSSWATCYKIPEEVFSADFRTDFPIPLGSPLLGTKVEVRDTNGSAVLEGEGQIFIGGEERICFLDDEITVPLGTMRETGDFVRAQNGNLFFLGRKDNQIKRHGKRFNIECLQQAAEDLCQVEACAVTWYQQEKLVLFVLPKDDLKEGETLKELQKHLPAYAVPDEIIVIKALPLTSHGKVDISELNKIYQNHLNSRRRDSKLSDAEELWERLQYLWKSVLGLLGDSTEISKDAVFLYSGGDSLKALRFYDEIEMLVGKTVPGLLEVILSRSIEEVYRHILKMLITDEDHFMNPDNVVKRKFGPNSGEEFHGKYIKLTSEIALEVTSGLIPFIALSRGNHFFPVNFTRSFMKPKNTVQVGVDMIQQPSFLHSKAPSIMKSHTQGYEMGERILTVTNKANKNDCSSVQQIHGECSHVTMAELALSIRWKSNTRKCVDASPLVVIPSKEEVSASVYVGSHSHAMQAVDLDLGEIKWEKTLGDRIESSACVSKCGNFVVVGCYDGLVYVLRSSDGEIQWTFVTEDTVKSSGVVDPSSGLVYIGSHDQHVYALDIYKKACVWKSHCEGGAVFSSPCLSSFPHHLYVATLGGLLLAVNPVTGSKLWKSFLGKPLFSSPHCNENYVCVGCVDGNLYCYTHSGEKVWQFSTNGPVFSSPCLSSLTKQEIFFGSHDCFIYCCNMEGNLLWKFEATSSVYGTPFIFQSDDLSNKILLAAVSTDGKVWILNAKSGTAEGVDKLPGEVFSSPVVWGTKLVVGCRNDYVYCLDLYITGKK
ncbi:PREDICTED: acyl-CoA synthetase family member 4 isoform X1 [Lepidothrix coronata]|uniref:Beta-alanine-activating enzyme n=1 Tax=Lepidothrix coronata TaxID=321398 RepID=A0A6J0I0I1_9PASS|nr:PREDICTED: acyl-CoA synthetase family member 4 isoform X1 [Lepidothrix coronata]XP_017679708.1 PREDICTED: acyl-CoA synthetase family member 4 isoform X1 [Lepidothrix coronata]XP_017679796.1 PREDICTED: acyl-CoA synthetase family member 4 isoform X1 [Lepidothrix coronata]XP_017679880.1 PREDICTED: acyl-CoA synthetase family member 4 isoform X1 [Lepidothrix coronata]